MNKFTAIGYLWLITFEVVACSGSSELQQATNQPTTTLQQFISQYEKNFDPSKYDVGSLLITIEQPKAIVEVQPQSDSAKAQQEETTLGYRVQVITTQSIEEANVLRDSLGNLLPTEWIYIVHDVPAYKVRIGNFTERGDAIEMVKMLTEKGIPDVWIVPDQVLKYPQIKLPRVVMPIDTTKE